MSKQIEGIANIFKKCIRQDYDEETDKVLRDETTEPVKDRFDCFEHDCNECKHLCKKDIVGILIAKKNKDDKDYTRTKGVFRTWFCEKLKHEPEPDWWHIEHGVCKFEQKDKDETIN